MARPKANRSDTVTTSKAGGSPKKTTINLNKKKKAKKAVSKVGVKITRVAQPPLKTGSSQPAKNLEPKPTVTNTKHAKPSLKSGSNSLIPVSNVLADKARGRQPPAKQSPAKPRPLTHLINAPKPQIPRESYTKIWTPLLAQGFYTNLNALSTKTQTPKYPNDYRSGSHGRKSTNDYALRYEEELHVADHFAFLAHWAEGVEYVSAATLEESSQPPSFTIRVASNHTPAPKVKEGLEKIISVVGKHAAEGRHAEEHRMSLFNEVLTFSQKRVYARLRGARWEKPKHLKNADLVPLSKQITAILSKIEAHPLKSDLGELVKLLRDVDQGSDKEQFGLLKAVIFKSHAISNQNSSKSLEATLRQMNLQPQVYESRAVLEIDKLGRYLSLCHDLIRLSRQPTTRLHCQSMSLEICTAFPSSWPSGAVNRCFVHAEVQLVLFYEHNPKIPPPRAMGASKSACFLCDLFLKHRGVFGISHSHMKLYPLWTIPETTWMNTQQIHSFQSTIRAMILDIKKLLTISSYPCNMVIESRAHLLQVTHGSPLASSLQSPVNSMLQLQGGRRTTICPIPETTSIFSPLATTFYHLQDLPIAVDIVPSTISCILLVGKVDYIFDLADVRGGQLQISEWLEIEDESAHRSIDVRQLQTDKERHIVKDVEMETVVFNVHDAGNLTLQIVMTWDVRAND